MSIFSKAEEELTDVEKATLVTIKQKTDELWELIEPYVAEHMSLAEAEGWYRTMLTDLFEHVTSAPEGQPNASTEQQPQPETQPQEQPQEQPQS